MPGGACGDVMPVWSAVRRRRYCTAFPGHGPVEPFGETTVVLRFGAPGGLLSAVVLRVSARCERIMVTALPIQ